ncbi:MAG: hypothetical protein V3T00_08865 [bacterium]|nr:hypothetical protein [SAR324 cluster bacterium]
MLGKEDCTDSAGTTAFSAAAGAVAGRFGLSGSLLSVGLPRMIKWATGRART